MDVQSRRVFIEIVEAGIAEVTELPEPSWNAVYMEFFALARGLSACGTGLFFRRRSSAWHEDMAVASAMRQRNAASLHRLAASIVGTGIRTAVPAMQLNGTGATDALDTVAERLMSTTEEGQMRADGPSGHLRTAEKCYAEAAGTLFVIHDWGLPDGIEDFSWDISTGVVPFAVAAAATTRAIETPT